jgi:hypothetical protein
MTDINEKGLILYEADVCNALSNAGGIS